MEIPVRAHSKHRGENTMVFNQKARELLMFCGAEVNVPSHDWWLHLATSGCVADMSEDVVLTVRCEAKSVCTGLVSCRSREQMRFLRRQD